VEVELRPGRVEDAPGLARVSVDSWRAAYRGLVAQPYVDTLSYGDRERWWTERLVDAAVEPWVLVVEGQVEGFVTLMEALPEDGGPPVGEVEGIYLHPSLWGQGLGRRLMELAEDRLGRLGHAEAILWVIDGNRRAERFYLAAGWVPEDRFRSHPRLGVKLRRVSPGPAKGYGG
jgi:GNAT superfamily N-acetyltransferase